MAEPAHAMVGYVLYGSASGEGGYDILGHSDQVTLGEQEVVARFSNVGGSVLLEDRPEAIYTFYPLAPASERWAFTKIIFLRKGPRGNVYGALTLVLDTVTLDDLRWEPFMLREVFRVVEERKTAIPLSRTKLEAASRRPLSLETGIDPNQLAAVLRGLASGAVGFACAGRGEGVTVCRAVLAALPPDDRRRLSFCTRYSYRRSLEFHLAFYMPADEEEIGRYLGHAGIAARGQWSSLPSQQDLIWSWCQNVVAEELDPLSGLTPLQNPRNAVRLSSFLSLWVKEGSAPPGMDREERKQIIGLVSKGRNKTLESIRRLLKLLAWDELRDRLATALAANSSFVAELAVVSRWITTVTGEDLPLEVLYDLSLQCAAAATADLMDRTACVFLLLVAADPRPDLLLGPSGSRTAFQSPDEIARWIEGLVADHSQACLDLLTICLRRWQALPGMGCVAVVQSVAKALAARTAPPAVAAATLLLAAFEQAAPESPEERANWLLELLRRVGPAAGPAFHSLRASRIAAQEELIGKLTETEVAALAEPLADRFPGPLARQLDWDRMPAGPGLFALLTRCEESLLPGDLAGWDVAASPGHWDLASRVALRSTQVAGTAGGSGLWRRLAWLLWCVARLTAAGRVPAAAEADRRFTAALEAGFVQRPSGVMHILADAAFHERRAGRHAGRELRCPAPQKVWLQTLQDIRDHCPAGARFYSLTVLSHLELDGFFAG